MALYEGDAYVQLVEKLRRAREELGITEEQAAAAFGRSETFIASVEEGTRRIDPVELCRFAVVYQKPVSWFLPDTES